MMNELMKRLSMMFLLPAMVLAMLFGSCNSRSAAIEAMVDELNSPAFRAMEARTGLFDDSKAEIKGDTLEITFLCRPYINLAQIDRAEIPTLKESAVAEFRNNLADEKFRDGIEALAEEKMTLLLVWQDVNGGDIKIDINPQEVLGDSKK